jgi:eukaryotic-like serine/threonine-protein kinase
VSEPAAAELSRVKALFLEVCDLPDDAARRAHLAAQGVDEATVARVLALVARDREATAIAAPLQPAIASTTDDDEASELSPGDQLGPWQLLATLGEGGMGRVFLAERRDGLYQRQVAIKLLHGGADPHALVMLARERQILATLTHPHIARLLDGGTTPGGRPYLVMEYVQGQRIDEWCAAQQLDLGGRLVLFDQVCSAVAQAHRQLVVHCDIKPANVLVTPQGQAMLLDFGIARLEDQDDQGARGFTPRYASPEQRAGNPATAASDIYSLPRL